MEPVDVPEPAPLHFDTEDGRLARAGVSVARCESGEDAGWHLTVPTDDGVHRVRAALTRSLVVPVRLRRHVVAWTRGAELIPMHEAPVLGSGRLADQRRPKPGKPARLVLHARLVEQVEELLLRDCDVRLGLPDGVHRFRVACRRLRAALGTFADLLETETTVPIRAELRWVVRTLGPARDAEVARDRVRGLVANDHVVGPVRRRVDATYRALARDARDQTVAAMSSQRYFNLLAALDQLISAPSWTQAAERPARTLGRYAHADWRRMRRRVRRLDASQEIGPAALDDAFHAVRRSAKRLRYAAETLEPVTGRRVRHLGDRSRDVTRLLGDLQDTVFVRRDLLALASAATASGENAFTYGRQHLREEQHADHLHGEFDRVWRRLAKSVDRAELKET